MMSEALSSLRKFTLSKASLPESGFFAAGSEDCPRKVSSLGVEDVYTLR